MSTNEPEERAPEPSDAEPSPGRRRFLTALSLAIGALAASVAAIPVVGVLVSPVRRRARRWMAVAELDELEIGRTVKVVYTDPEALPWAGPAASTAAWLRRESEDRVVVLSAYCTHVGCPTRWSERAGLFLCPCHGGAFYADGTVAAGPPPRPLPLHPVRVREGRVEILPQPTAPRAVT